MAIASGPLSIDAEHIGQATRGHLSSEICGLKTQTGQYELLSQEHVDWVDPSTDVGSFEDIKYTYMLFGHV